MLEITNLHKSFRKFTAINKLSLTIPEPGLSVFVGANGSGKTTLFNLINGLILPNSGKIIFGNKSELAGIRAKSGISTEPFTTEPSLTIADIFQICRKTRGPDELEIKKWMDFWKLTEFVDKPFKTLSTGMKKRLSLALSLIGNPLLLLWDEPYNGLDPLGIELLNQLILELSNAEKFVLISTHLLNEIKFKKARYFVLNEGKLLGDVYSNQSDKNTYETILNLLKTGNDKY